MIGAGRVRAREDGVGEGDQGRRARLAYGHHAARAVLERRPTAIASASILAGFEGEPLTGFHDRLVRLGIPVRRLSRAQLDDRASGGRHQGIILELQGDREFSLSDFEELCRTRGRRLRLLALDGVEDPRNLGACLRTADAAGIDAVVLPRARAAKLTAVALKAAAGAAETVPVLHVPNLVRTLKWLKQVGVWVVGTHAAARTSLFDAKLEAPIAVVLGGEGRGLRRLTAETCDELVSIPMHGTVESLNVSVATGIVLFELLRQTGKAASG